MTTSLALDAQSQRPPTAAPKLKSGDGSRAVRAEDGDDLTTSLQEMIVDPIMKTIQSVEERLAAKLRLFSASVIGQSCDGGQTEGATLKPWLASSVTRPCTTTLAHRAV